MIRNVERTWFEVWGNETAQNQILKGLLLVTFALCAIQAIAITCLGLRKPVLIAISSAETRILAPTPPNQELLSAEIKRVISTYLTTHHNWDWSKIHASFEAAANYVGSDFRKKYFEANRDQERIAAEKRISQLFYISDLQLDLKSKTATVHGDRILVIESLRAANPMTFEVAFDYGPRSVQNPEGIYVTAEKLINQSKP
jgi:hypothetical protein